MGTICQRSYNGKTVWEARVRRKGFTPVSCVFKNKQTAARWLARKERQIAEFKSDAGENALRVDMRELIDRYEKHILPQRTESVNTARAQRCHLQFWRGEVGAVKVSDVTVALLSRAREKILAGGRRKTSTVNRYISTLSSLFEVAVSQWQCAICNPCKEIKRLREPEGRNNYAEVSEIARLLEAAAADKNTHMLPALRLAMGTGARKSEISHIESRNVYLERGMIRLVVTKNGKERMIYPDADTMNMLRALKEEGGIYLFGHPRTGQPYDNRRAWERTRAAAGMKHYRMHDNRHTFATFIGMAGAPATDIAALTGHKKLENVTIYTHHAQSQLAARAAEGQALMFKEVA